MLADDAPLIRSGVALVLAEGGIDVVAQVADAPALLAAVEAFRPDVVVTDVRMPPRHSVEGLDAAVVLQQRHPEVGILLLSNHAETRHLAALLDAARAGVGYLLKERVIDTDAFVAVVHRVAGGGTAVDPEIAELLLARRPHRAGLAALTAREREVLAAMATGASNAAISQDLRLSPKTVAAHIQRILLKLGLGDEAPNDNRRVKAVLSYLAGL